MSDYKVTDSELTGIANAIRTKGGTSSQLVFPDGFTSAIGAIPTGGGSQNILGGTVIPESSQGSDGDIYIKYTDYGNIPSGYTALRHVQFVPGAYIDTGIIPSNHFTEISVNDTVYGNDKHWIGTNSSGTSYYQFTTYNNRYYWGITGGEANGGTWTVGKHTLKYNKDNDYKVIIDGEVIGSGNPIASAGVLQIGRRSGNANAGNFWVYYCKITDKGTNELVCNLVPVKRNSDSVIGFYDLIGDEFHANAGSGTLIAGEEETSETPIDAAYLKVNGSWILLEDGDWADVNKGS